MGVRRFFVPRGYAWLSVDSRGSGASFGHRPCAYSPDEVREVIEDAGPYAEVLTEPGPNVVFLALDCEKAPFNSMEVRRAVASSIPKDVLVEKYVAPCGIPARGLLSTHVYGYHENMEAYPYNPGRAKDVLRFRP